MCKTLPFRFNHLYWLQIHYAAIGSQADVIGWEPSLT